MRMETSILWLAVWTHDECSSGANLIAFVHYHLENGDILDHKIYNEARMRVSTLFKLRDDSTSDLVVFIFHIFSLSFSLPVSRLLSRLRSILICNLCGYMRLGLRDIGKYYLSTAAAKVLQLQGKGKPTTEVATFTSTIKP